MAALLALLAAAAYGTGDFLGGVASRRASAVSVLVTGHAVGLLLIAAAAALVRAGAVGAGDLAWGGAAGVAGGVGVLLLYRGLAVGPMSIVAPVTGVCAAGLPVVVGTLLGERAAWTQYAGVVIAVGAIALAAGAGVGGLGTRLPLATLALAVTSGVAFAGFYVTLSRTSTASGLWPLVASRAVSAGIFAVVGAVSGRPLRARGPALRPTLGAAVVDTAANVFYLLAVRRGLLSLVAVVTSLYPAMTVLLAGRVTGERLRRSEVVGLGLAGLAVVLIVGT